MKHVAKLDLIVSLSILNFAILAMGPEKLLQMLKNYYQETSLPLFKERKKVFVWQNIYLSLTKLSKLFPLYERPVTKDEQACLGDIILIFFVALTEEYLLFFNAIKIETTLKPVNDIDQRNVDFFCKKHSYVPHRD